jgi:hypothetical protein
MNEVYELVLRGNEAIWNRVEGDMLPDWAQNREPDYHDELVLTDRPAGFNRFAAIGVPRVLLGSQVILRISANSAEIWERVRPT